jgi:crotonobetainyl-CoA:carnitine CoA-transferase CaiB-like acyl-CoA transferase
MLTTETLAGLRILEIGESIAAPYCAKLMADLGAEVIKIEDPLCGGDPARAHGPFPGDVPDTEKSGLFLWLNQNKQGLTLNLRERSGRQILEKLLAGAEVLVHNLSVARAAGLGLDYESLRQLKPSLVVTAITAFGQDGLYRDLHAAEINCQAAGGLSVATGDRGREPLAMPLSIGAYQAGAMAASATLVAALSARRTGEGKLVDISEVEVLANNHVGTHLVNYIYRGIGGIRQGHHGGYFYYPCTCLPCRDGYVCLLAPQGGQWRRFVEVMGSPEWTREPRFQNRRKMAEEYPDEADARLYPWLKERSKEEIFRVAIENHIPFAPEKTIDEVAADPQLKERDFFLACDHPVAGQQRYPGAAYEIERLPGLKTRPAPLLGEHNRPILGRLGYSEQDQEMLRRHRIV